MEDEISALVVDNGSGYVYDKDAILELNLGKTLRPMVLDAD